MRDAERASLEALSRKRIASRSLAERALVVLACADEGGKLSTDPEFIGKVRNVVGRDSPALGGSCHG
jgi:hypothetical protein